MSETQESTRPSTEETMSVIVPKSSIMPVIIVVTVFIIVAGIAAAVLFMRQRQADEAELEAERTLKKINWQQAPGG